MKFRKAGPLSRFYITLSRHQSWDTEPAVQSTFPGLGTVSHTQATSSQMIKRSHKQRFAQ